MTNTVRFIKSIHQIGKDQWDALLSTDNPFLRFEFLAALEDSQCIDSPKLNKSDTNQILNSGWIPNYLLLENETHVLAIAPVYQKLHSYGEYVFDWSWADAYQQHGLNYYPKLVWAIPFTPSTGPRIVSQGNPEQLVTYHQEIAQGLTAYCLNNHFSGWHCLFPDALGLRSLGSKSINAKSLSVNHSNKDPLVNAINNNIMHRTSCQFHWFNEGFSNFSHYLEKFTSRKRKNIKKERLKLRESGFIFHRKVADQITPADIKNFYHCYQLTYAKRNMQGYLTLEFFLTVLATMPDQLVLVQAQYESHDSNTILSIPKTVANALYFKDGDNLYGRYWGCLEEFDSLHFECCYYQGIEYCIENDISHFDPGTQGEHKISRGFEPTICHSQHWIAHPEFSDAIQNFLKEEQFDIDDYALQASQHLPFNQSSKSSLQSSQKS